MDYPYGPPRRCSSGTSQSMTQSPRNPRLTSKVLLCHRPETSARCGPTALIYRVALGIDQTDFARQVNLAQSRYNQCEPGVRSPTIDAVDKTCDVRCHLGLTVSRRPVEAPLLSCY